MCGRDIELNQAGMAALAEVSHCCTKLWEWNFWVSCYLTIVMQGTDLCNVFMCSNIPGCWGGQGVCVCIPKGESWYPEKREVCPSWHPNWWVLGTEQLTGSSCLQKQHHEVFLCCQLDLCYIPAQPSLQACSVKLQLSSAGFYFVLLYYFTEQPKEGEK